MSNAWRGGSTTAWRRIRAVVLHRDGRKCQIGGPRCTTRATHVDHVIAKAHGGTDEPSNLRAACSACNLMRGADPRDPPARPSRTHW